MSRKCKICNGELITHNNIQSMMIDNPYVGTVLFECPKCKVYYKYSLPITWLYKKKKEWGAKIFDEYVVEVENAFYEDYQTKSKEELIEEMEKAKNEKNSDKVN